MSDHRSPAMTALARHPDGRVEELGADRLDEIDQLCAIDGTLIWVSAVSPDADTIVILRREYAQARPMQPPRT